MPHECHDIHSMVARARTLSKDTEAAGTPLAKAVAAQLLALAEANVRMHSQEYILCDVGDSALRLKEWHVGILSDGTLPLSDDIVDAYMQR